MKEPITVIMDAELANHNSTKQLLPEQTISTAISTTGRKKCPFCAELIQAEAIKCRYCNEFLDGPSRVRSRTRDKKWYFATPTVVLTLLFLGPLALPLVWLNPHYKPVTRTIISLVVFIVTFLCLYEMIHVYERIFNQLDALGM